MASRFWRGCRLGFRWCRIAFLLLILAAVGLVFYCNQVGVPAWLKDPLIANLKARGIQLEFTRMRLRMTRGIVVENVRVGSARQPDSPVLTLAEAQLLLEFSALLHGQVEVQGLEVRGGRLEIPVPGTGPGEHSLVVSNLETALRWQANDTWSLDHFQAVFQGATFTVAGDVAHAMELQKWEIFRGHRAGASAAGQNEPNGPARWQSFAVLLDQIKLDGTPRLALNIEGDARDWHSFAVHLLVEAPAARTPWFSAKNLQFHASLAALKNLPTNLVLTGLWSNAEPYRLAWSTRFNHLRAPGVTAAAVQASGNWRVPELAFEVQLQSASQTWQAPAAKVQRLQLAARVRVPTAPPAGAPLPGFWTNLQPYQIDWNTRLGGLDSELVHADRLAAGGSWRSPALAITNLVVYLGGGQLQAQGGYDVARQVLTFTNDSVFDLRAVTNCLPAITRERLAQIQPTQPPGLHARGRLDFSPPPGVTNRAGKSAPTVVLQVETAFTNAAVGPVPLDLLQARVNYSNQVWTVPELKVARAQTQLALRGFEDEKTKAYQVQIQGLADANQIRPFITASNAVRELKQWRLAAPVGLAVTINGQLHELGTVTLAGRLAVTNVSVRGTDLESLVTDLTYSNQVLLFDHPQARRAQGTQLLMADAIVLDLSANQISFTNGFTSLAPQLIANVIGPKTGRTLEPYVFVTPPSARVNGHVALNSSDEDDAADADDLQFDIIQGAPFHWLRFNTRRVEGTVHWFGDTLLLTNLNAEFYGGEARGMALLDFQSHPGTDFSFSFDVTNAGLHQMVAELGQAATNQLAGLVGGRLVVTDGNSTNWQVMNGYGHASLREGLIWDAPIFGIMSPALNAVSPGLGSSKATDATAQFTMTRGVIHSDNMEIHTTLARLEYNGDVDLYQNLNAKVTARPLRDTWGLGGLISAAVWPVSKLFEYKVTGTLGSPQLKPLYDVSKVLLAPFHPLKTLEDILPAGATNAGFNLTNAPPRK